MGRGTRFPRISTEIAEANDFVNIATATETVVKATSGILATVVINGGTMGAITIYHGTVVGGVKIATIAAPSAGMVLPYGVHCPNGITVVTAVATDITVTYL